MRHRTKSRREKNEGAAMLVTMLVLLSTTALAVFAVHSTTFEIRAAGHARQGMQSQYLGETGLNAAMTMVDNEGVQALRYLIDRQTAEFGAPILEPMEPNLAPSKKGYRVYVSDLDTRSTTPLVEGSLSSMGSRYPFEPTFVVDVNDQYRSVQAIPGQRADGHGRLMYLHATYTSRGRMRLGLGSEPYEAASDGRAYARSGPAGQ